jgi:hypothetical protein
MCYAKFKHFTDHVSYWYVTGILTKSVLCKVAFQNNYSQLKQMTKTVAWMNDIHKGETAFTYKENS